jgi:hypothetical protein
MIRDVVRVQSRTGQPLASGIFLSRAEYEDSMGTRFMALHAHELVFVHAKLDVLYLVEREEMDGRTAVIALCESLEGVDRAITRDVELLPPGVRNRSDYDYQLFEVQR